MSVVSNLPQLYEEKENLMTNSSIPENKKVTANDMNIIKSLLENGSFVDPNSNNKLVDHSMNELNPIISRYEKLKYDLVTDGPAVKTGRKIDGKNEWVIKKSFDGAKSNDSRRLSFNLPSTIVAHGFEAYVTHPVSKTILVKAGWFLSTTAPKQFSAHGYQNGDVQVVTGECDWISSGMKYYATVYFTYTENEPEPEIPGTDEDPEILKNYVKFSDYAMTTKGGIVKLGNNFNLDDDGQAKCDTVDTYENYLLLSDNAFISKGILEIIRDKTDTKIQAIDDEIGDISSVLDSINGETV